MELMINLFLIFRIILIDIKKNVKSYKSLPLYFSSTFDFLKAGPAFFIATSFLIPFLEITALIAYLSR